MLVDLIPNIYDYTFAAAFVIYVLYFILSLRKKGVPLWHLCLSALFILFFSILGGRLMWATEHIDTVTLGDIFSLEFGSWRIAGVLVANCIAALIITYIYYKYYNVTVSTTLGIFLEAVFLEFALNKLACFLGGCCYGVETTLPWGMNFGDGLLRHPTQLYELICYTGIFIVARLLRDKFSTTKKYAIAIILYLIVRMIVEPLREEAEVYLNGPTRPIYFVILIICIVIIFKDSIYNLVTSKINTRKRRVNRI